MAALVIELCDVVDLFRIAGEKPDPTILSKIVTHFHKMSQQRLLHAHIDGRTRPAELNRKDAKDAKKKAEGSTGSMGDTENKPNANFNVRAAD